MTFEEQRVIIEQYFHDHWTETEIVYDTEERIPTNPRFIHVIIEPTDCRYGGICKEKVLRGKVIVRCYAENYLEASKIADSVAIFFGEKTIGGIEVGLPDPLGKGAFTESQGGAHYYTLAFNIES